MPRAISRPSSDTIETQSCLENCPVARRIPLARRLLPFLPTAAAAPRSTTMVPAGARKSDSQTFLPFKPRSCGRKSVPAGLPEMTAARIFFSRPLARTTGMPARSARRAAFNLADIPPSVKPPLLPRSLRSPAWVAVIHSGRMTGTVFRSVRPPPSEGAKNPSTLVRLMRRSASTMAATRAESVSLSPKVSSSTATVSFSLTTGTTLRSRMRRIACLALTNRARSWSPSLVRRICETRTLCGANASAHAFISSGWPTAAAACRVATSAGRRERPRRIMPKPTAPEDTRMICRRSGRLRVSAIWAAMFFRNPLSTAWSAPRRSDVPTLMTTRRAVEKSARSSSFIDKLHRPHDDAATRGTSGLHQPPQDAAGPQFRLEPQHRVALSRGQHRRKLLPFRGENCEGVAVLNNAGRRVAEDDCDRPILRRVRLEDERLDAFEEGIDSNIFQRADCVHIRRQALLPFFQRRPADEIDFVDGHDHRTPPDARIKAKDLVPDQPEIGVRVARRVEQDDERPRPLDVLEKPVSEPAAFVGPFDQPRNVGEDDRCAVFRTQGAEIGRQRGERIIGDFGPRGGQRGQERGLAAVGKSDDGQIGEELERKPDAQRATGRAMECEPGEAIFRRCEPRVSSTAAPAARDGKPFAVRYQIGDEIRAVRAGTLRLQENLGTDRDANGQVLCGASVFSVAAAVLAVIGVKGGMNG